MNCIAAGTPPTVTAVVSAGFGRLAMAVSEGGAAPVDTAGDIAPAPVMYRVTILPRAALVSGTGAPFASTKIPGAAGDTVNERDTVWPLAMTLRTAVVSKGVS